MPKALVAGGAGFIGSHLIRRLLDLGYGVTVVDSLITGRRSNLQSLMDLNRFEFFHDDITRARIESSGWAQQKYDWIFHLASPASPVAYMREPFVTMKANSFGTLNLLELAHEMRARFLFASSSEVYGDPELHPQPEIYRGNVSPIGPRAVYDESKRFGETLVASFFRQYGLSVKIARIFNTYGPGMRMNDGRVVPNFIARALIGQPIGVNGDGLQTRSFCYVEDMIDGLIRLMEQPRFSGPINLGSPQEVTIIYLANLIRDLIESESEIIYQPLPKDDPIRRQPDITRAQILLKWEPKIDLIDGLKRTIEWFRVRM